MNWDDDGRVSIFAVKRAPSHQKLGSMKFGEIFELAADQDRAKIAHHPKFLMKTAIRIFDFQLRCTVNFSESF